MQVRLWSSDRALKIPEYWDKRLDLAVNDEGEQLVGYWHVNEGVYYYVYDYTTTKHTEIGALYHLSSGAQVCPHLMEAGIDCTNKWCNGLQVIDFSAPAEWDAAWSTYVPRNLITTVSCTDCLF